MKQYEETIDRILSRSGSKVIDKIGEKISAVEGTIASAESKMSEAIRAGNEKAYIAAKAEKDEAATLLEMYHDLEHSMNEKPLISEDKYKEMTEGIMQELTAACKADKLEVIALCNQIRAVAERNAATIEKGNNILHRLQADVFRYADCPKTESGQPIVAASYTKEFKDYTLPGWAEYALNCVQYTAMTEGTKD